MAGMYTQEDFIRELELSGLGGSFSDADLKLAMINPDAGMSLLSQKKAWGAATTDEGRAAANAAAEDIRRQYGGYTGGADGSGYTLEPVSPGSFGYGEAPTYQNQYGGTLNSLLNQQITYGSFNDNTVKPTYQNQYAGQMNELLEQQKNYGSFNYGEAPTYQNQYAGQMNELLEQQKNYGSFNYGEAPTYQNQYAGQMGALLDKQLNYGSFTDDTVKPTYDSRYDGQIQDVLGKVSNPEKFTYDAESDPLYAQYAKTYAREGRRASEDALGQAAAMTGGRPSSYAVTASQQAGNYYAAQMADKLPELYDRAYNQYLNDYQMQQAALQSLMSAEAQDYAKYQDSLGQYNADRNFAYEQYLNDYNRVLQDAAAVRDMEQSEYAKYLDSLSQYNADRNFAYGQYMDEYDRLAQQMAAAQAMEQSEYAKYLDSLSQYNADRNFAYGQYMDEYDRLAQQMAAAQAMEQSEYAKYLDSLSQYNADRNFAYGNLLDSIDYQTQRRQEAQEQKRYDREWQYQLQQDALDRELYDREWQYQLQQDALDRELYDREWQYQVGQDALDRETNQTRYDAEYRLALAEMAAEMGDLQFVRDLGITPSSGMVESAAQTAADAAKYMNFELGYWDEPGVREYIRSVTGLEPERYAEYLMFSEGIKITYKPAQSNPKSVTTNNGGGRIHNFITNQRS